MPRVDLRTLTDPILMRLHRISREMMQDQQPAEVTDWQQIAWATQQEILRRGFVLQDVQHLAVVDSEQQRTILSAFQSERTRKRSCHSSRNSFSWRDVN
jgi:hypothetical protein